MYVYLRLFFIICLISTSSLSVFSQKSPFKWGNIPQDQLEMTDCEFDSGADAVVLASWGTYDLITSTEKGTKNLGRRALEGMVSTTTLNVKVKYNYHFRIKILSPEGLEKANVKIPYWKGDAVSSIKAQVINVIDGKAETIKMKGTEVIDEENEDVVSYKKFAFPNVKVGSIIEYSYTVISENLYSLRPWYFQGEIPIISSIYEGVNMKEFIYVSMLKESQEIKKREEKGVKGPVYKWSASNVPSMKEEKYVTNVEDYYSQVKFQLQGIEFPGQPYRKVMSSWSNVANNFIERDDFGIAMRGKGGIDKAALSVFKGLKTQEEKLNAVYNLIQEEYQWNGLLGYYPDQNLGAIVKSKKGDGASLNLLLLSALKSLEIEAYPVMISTRDHGAVQEAYPFTSQFNHTIVYAYVDGKDLLIDQATNSGPYNILPIRNLNGKGFMLTESGGEWINLGSQGKKDHTCSGSVKLSKEGMIEGVFEFSDKSYSGLYQRREIGELGEAAFFEEMFEDLNEVNLVSTLCEEANNYAVPLRKTIELKTTDYANVLNDFIYLKPMMFEAWNENPFKLKERKYPVDFGTPITDFTILTIDIPEGYAVEELPEPARVTLNDKGIIFSYKTIVQENKLQVNSRVMIKQLVFQPEEYEQLKEFFDLVVAKHAEQIVLKKVN